MSVSLYPHQKKAIEKLGSGSILCGGVGSGKSITALAYFITKVCQGTIDEFGDVVSINKLRDLYIITTARKRDTLEWDSECAKFMLSQNVKCSILGIKVVIDSWNNIMKYKDVQGAFFIFDEQRVVGYGEWVKAFLKITKKNRWILLSATPGDSWADYIPVFIANGFYSNRTEFLRKHAVFDRYSKYPRIDRWINCDELIGYRNRILVRMNYKKKTISHIDHHICGYDKSAYIKILKERWNIYKDHPIKNISELCHTLRRVVNTDEERLIFLESLLTKHQRAIIFYNFDYELDILRKFANKWVGNYGELNGHRHDPIPTGDQWVYLVQYNSGAEGWNCVETNVIIFYSQNYSYRIMTQAAGRIDRLNTPYVSLFYYHIRSNSPIDIAIQRALKEKRTFNESEYLAEKTYAIIEGE